MDVESRTLDHTSHICKGFPLYCNFKIKMMEVTYKIKQKTKVKLNKVVFLSRVSFKLSEIEQIENSSCVVSFNKILQVYGTSKCQIHYSHEWPVSQI